VNNCAASHNTADRDAGFASRVYTNTDGSQIEPQEHAAKVERKEIELTRRS